MRWKQLDQCTVSRETGHNYYIFITYKVVSHLTETHWNQLGLKK